jgi:hypothetical protein
MKNLSPDRWKNRFAYRQQSVVRIDPSKERAM